MYITCTLLGTIQARDPDATCRQLAVACSVLQADLAQRTSAMLATQPACASLGGPVVDVQASVVAASSGLSRLVLPGGGSLGG